MKTYFSFFLLFAFWVITAQENDLCKKFLEKEKIELQKFKENEINNQLKYRNLREKLFKDIKNNKEIKTENIFLCIVSNTFVNDYIPSGSENDCRYKSTLYYDKREFLDSLFWNKETFNFVKKTFNNNIFPVISYNGGIELTNKNFLEFFSDGNYDFIRKFSTINLSKDEQGVYYIPKKKSKKKTINGITKILVAFKDYESVNNVEITISNSLSKPNIIRNYQFINYQWKLIEIKN